MKNVSSFILLLIVLLAGCYTVIKHPPIQNNENPSFTHEVYLTDDCMSCHQNQSITFNQMRKPFSPQLDYIRSNHRWSYFYESPWWNREIFSSHAPVSGSGNTSPLLPTTSARNRFPGSGGSSSGASTTSITGGGSSGTHITGQGNQNSGNSTPQVKQREKENQPRTTIRGSGKSDGKSSSSRKAKRRKNK